MDGSFNRCEPTSFLVCKQLLRSSLCTHTHSQKTSTQSTPELRFFVCAYVSVCVCVNYIGHWMFSRHCAYFPCARKTAVRTTFPQFCQRLVCNQLRHAPGPSSTQTHHLWRDRRGLHFSRRRRRCGRRWEINNGCHIVVYMYVPVKFYWILDNAKILTIAELPWIVVKLE